MFFWETSAFITEVLVSKCDFFVLSLKCVLQFHHVNYHTAWLAGFFP